MSVFIFNPAALFWIFKRIGFDDVKICGRIIRRTFGGFKNDLVANDGIQTHNDQMTLAAGPCLQLSKTSSWTEVAVAESEVQKPKIVQALFVEEKVCN